MLYPRRCSAIFSAMYYATGNPLLISECQDFEAGLRDEGYVLRPLKSRNGKYAVKPSGGTHHKGAPCCRPAAALPSRSLVNVRRSAAISQQRLPETAKLGFCAGTYHGSCKGKQVCETTNSCFRPA